MNNPAESSEGDRLVNEIIASFLEAEAAGQHPDRAELLARHPDLAEELRAFFADHDGMRHMARPAGSPAECATLAPNQTAAAAPGMRLSYFGDYELLEEIARGGMG
ncbi:MAG TPA: hypothetical protein VG013_01470, partial [Gemmataceae bacterium]|nr:hypothetical protein [Gemmataceae bacterium]